MLVSAVPYFADHLSLWISRVQSGLSGYTLTAFTLRQVVEWGTVPLAGLLFVSLTLPLSKAGIRLQWKASIRSRWCLAFSLAFACLVLIVLMWAPPQFALSLTGQEDLVPVAIFLGWVCVACDTWPRKSGNCLLFDSGHKLHDTCYALLVVKAMLSTTPHETL